MLGKLIKYEFKATYKVFLLLYSLLLISVFFTILTSFNVSNNDLSIMALLNGLSYILFVLIIITMGIFTTVIVITRFYKIFGDEGYLIHTLPVTADEHILSKGIVGIIWNLLTGVFIFLSIFLIMAANGLLSIFDEADPYIDELLSMLNFSVPLFIFFICLIAFLGIIYHIISWYACIAIGPHVTKNRLLGTLISYLVFYIISSILGYIPSMIFQTKWLMQFEENSAFLDEFAYMVNTIPILFIVTIIIIIITNIVCYILTRKFIKDKLNLA